MKQKNYKYHLFFCNNSRDNNKKCCQKGSDTNADEIFAYTKNKIIELGLWGKPDTDKVRVSTTGCMGQCSLGPVLLVYPDAVWYKYNNKADIDLILENHVLNNKPVESLFL